MFRWGPPQLCCDIFEESACIAEEQSLKSSSLVFSIGLSLAVYVTIRGPVCFGFYFLLSACNC